MSDSTALQLEVVETTPVLTDVSLPKDSFVEMLGFSNETEIAVLPKEEIRLLIYQIEKFIKENAVLIEVPIVHHFSKGVYAREMPMKKGELVVGKIHKYENFNVLSKGRVSILSIDGIKILDAPYSFVGSPGTKRVIYAHEDSVWTVVHGTNEKDVDKIEADVIAKDYNEVFEYELENYLNSDKSLNSVLRILGFTEKQLQEISNNPDDLIDFPNFYDVEVKDSPIHGKGLFATKDFSAGDVICLARFENKRTPAGKYSNHSKDANAKMVMLDNSDVQLIAEQNIKSGEEILTDYFFNYTNTKVNLCLG